MSARRFPRNEELLLTRGLLPQSIAPLVLRGPAALPLTGKWTAIVVAFQARAQ